MHGRHSHSPYLSVALKLSLLAAVLLAASQTGDWVLDQFDTHLTPRTEPAFHRLVMTATVIYVLLMALPFVPGVEIGLGLIAIFGPKIVPLVYACTVFALTIAFLVGRLLPEHKIIEMFDSLHLERAAELLRRLEPLAANERLAFLFQNASTRYVPLLLRHRFIALAIVLNLPGNALLGGGGGICLIAGFSRLLSFPAFLLTVAIAVAPIPLLILISAF